jgi:hypothetical protein
MEDIFMNGSEMKDNNPSPEEQFIKTGRGKWSQSGVPHRGWTCIEIEDLGKPEMVCEMCESQNIRFVHVMQHPIYPKQLSVGRVCAGNMEGNLSAAQQRETRMQNRATKRVRWTKRNWKISVKGNQWIKSDGYIVTVFEKNGNWRASVGLEDAKDVRYLNKSYKSVDQAKLAAFDLVTKILASGPDALRN